MEIEISGLFIRVVAQLCVAAAAMLLTLCALAAVTADRGNGRKLGR